MIFMQFLRSLDDLLYEIATWLVFWPVTFWRTIRQPSAAMRYADAELGDAEADRYDDTLSPPLFLLLSLLISHALELALVGDSPLVASQQGLAKLISDDTSLLLVRLVFFSVFPLTVSLSILAARKRKLTRETLRPPFYALCYPTGVFALLLGIGTLLAQLHRGPVVGAIGAAVAVASFVWFAAVLTHWIRRTFRTTRRRAAWLTARGLAGGIVAFSIVAPLVA